MRLLFAIKSMSAAYGGAERILAAVANGLAERGHDVRVVTFDPPGSEPVYPLAAQVEYVPLDMGRADRPAGPFETAARVTRLRSTLRASRPDVAVGFMHSMFVPLALAAMGTRIPTVASEHIVPEHYRGRPVQYGLLLLAARLVDRITVVSEQARDLFPPLARKRMVVVPNPVLTIADGDPPARNTGRRVILNVGRLTHQKDQPTLLRAFAEIATERPDWHLRIVGDGPLRAELDALVRDNGLDDRVEVVGPSSRIEAEYANATVLAVSSRYESFGMVTAEGLAAGLPVVGFADCPGTNELVVESVNGLLAAGHDRALSLAEVLRCITGDDACRERLARNAPGSVARFALGGVLAEWEGLCETVASSR